MATRWHASRDRLLLLYSQAANQPAAARSFRPDFQYSGYGAWKNFSTFKASSSLRLDSLCSPDFQYSGYGAWKNFSTFKASSSLRLDSLCSSMNFYAQKRWASQAAAARSAVSDNKISIGPKSREMEKDGKETGVVYQGPISSTIKKVKLLSLSTCCLSVSLGPVITFMTSPEMNVILKGAVASSVIFLSASTTAALHWFVSPYIHKLRWQPGSESFEVEMMSWLATPITRIIRFADVRPPETNRPFVTFKADGNFYFVDTEHCHNKALLARLTPEKPSHHESAFKNL